MQAAIVKPPSMGGAVKAVGSVAPAIRQALPTSMGQAASGIRTIARNTGFAGPNATGGGVAPAGPTMQTAATPASGGALKVAQGSPSAGAMSGGATGALPGWANNPADADLGGMAGQMQAATTYQPTDDALVSAQLDKLLSKDSSYMQLARTKALQSGASRGLLNSSMTAGAGELAAIESAMPVAQGNAQAYFTAQRDNAAAQNQFSAASNDFARQGALARFNGTLDTAKQQRDLEFQREDLAKRDEWTQSDLDLRNRQLDSDNSYRDSQLGLSRDELAMRSDQGDRDLDLRGDSLALERDRFSSDSQFRNDQLSLTRDELAMREQQGNRDLDLRGDSLALERDRFGADSQYRNDQLGLSRDELAMRQEQGNRDLDIRQQQNQDSLQLERDRLGADQDYRDRQLDISQQELSDRASQADQQARTSLAEDIRQIRQQAIDAQRAIETDPKMSADAKARAIEAISNNAAQDIAEVVRFSGLDMPEAWPDWINTETESGAENTPPPPPPPPPPMPDWGEHGS